LHETTGRLTNGADVAKKIRWPALGWCSKQNQFVLTTQDLKGLGFETPRMDRTINKGIKIVAVVNPLIVWKRNGCLPARWQNQLQMMGCPSKAIHQHHNGGKTKAGELRLETASSDRELSGFQLITNFNVLIWL
jgi:hypothetical protein